MHKRRSHKLTCFIDTEDISIYYSLSDIHKTITSIFFIYVSVHKSSSNRGEVSLDNTRN